MTGRGPRPLGESLRTVTAGLGSRGRAIDLGRRWADAVGEVNAAHSRPDRLDGEHLTVVVDDPSWASELRYLSSQILPKLNADPKAPRITELRFRVAPGN